jgi:hypothetical protein
MLHHSFVHASFVPGRRVFISSWSIETTMASLSRGPTPRIAESSARPCRRWHTFGALFSHAVMSPHSSPWELHACMRCGHVEVAVRVRALFVVIVQTSSQLHHQTPSTLSDLQRVKCGISFTKLGKADDFLLNGVIIVTNGKLGV